MAMRRRWARYLQKLAQWGLFLLVLAYGAFALSSAGAEVLHQMDATVDAKERSAPIFFIVHAFAGTVPLIAGPLQWALVRRAETLRVHRIIGRTYAVGVLIAAVMALRLAVTFNVPLAARLSFVTLAVLWAGSTAIALRGILVGAVASHRAWMTRSYALTLFFVTFPVATAVAESGVWAYEVAYPVAVSLAWMVNLAIAEAWIRLWADGGRRSRRADAPRDTASAVPVH